MQMTFHSQSLFWLLQFNHMFNGIQKKLRLPLCHDPFFHWAQTWAPAMADPLLLQTLCSLLVNIEMEGLSYFLASQITVDLSSSSTTAQNWQENGVSCLCGNLSIVGILRNPGCSKFQEKQAKFLGCYSGSSNSVSLVHATRVSMRGTSCFPVVV